MTEKTKKTIKAIEGGMLFMLLVLQLAQQIFTRKEEKTDEPFPIQAD